jgi:hypothetical protein
LVKRNGKDTTLAASLVLIAATWACGGQLGELDEELQDLELGQDQQAIMVGSQMDCPNGPSGKCDALNVKPLLQSSDSVDVDVWDMRGTGCYDTSMSVVIQAALYNRTSAQALAGRTATYAAIQGGNNGGTPSLATNKYYERLSQSYRWAKQPDPVQPLHFPEVLDDFTGTKNAYPVGCNPDVYGSCIWNTLVATDMSGIAGRDFMCGKWAENLPACTSNAECASGNCMYADYDANENTPNTGLCEICTIGASHVTNHYVKSLMEKGVSMMVAYGRYVPHAVQDAGLPGYRITFTRDEAPHKVVFNGYQPGAFPLRVHDVGDARNHDVTVTTDMSAIATYDGVPFNQVRKFDFPNLQARQTFIEYDPSEYSDDKDDTVVTFVDHVDYLSLGLPSDTPAKQVFSGTWGSGWTTLMPFTSGGAACQLAYNSTTGAVHFDQFFANSNGASTVWSHTWAAGFTHFVPFYIDGEPRFIAYNRATGEVHFDAFPSNLQGPIIKAIRTWPTGIGSLVPFVLNGKNYLLMYVRETGAVSIRKINATGDNTSGVWDGNWSSGLTTFLPYTIDEHPYLVVYDSTTGLIHYDRINENLQGVSVKGTGAIGTGRKLSMIGSRAPGSFFEYTGDGVIRTRRLSSTGSESAIVWQRTGLSSATLTSPFTQAGKDYLLVYAGSSGAVRSYEMTLF